MILQSGLSDKIPVIGTLLFSRYTVFFSRKTRSTALKLIGCQAIETLVYAHALECLVMGVNNTPDRHQKSNEHGHGLGYLDREGYFRDCNNVRHIDSLECDAK